MLAVRASHRHSVSEARRAYEDRIRTDLTVETEKVALQANTAISSNSRNLFFLKRRM
jgi:hypothetical protein